MNGDDIYTGQCPENFDPNVWAALTRDQKIAVQHLRCAEMETSEKRTKNRFESSVAYATVLLSIFLGMKDYFAVVEDRTLGEAALHILLHLVVCGAFLGVFSSAYNHFAARERGMSKASHIAAMIGIGLASLLIDSVIFKALGYI